MTYHDAAVLAEYHANRRNRTTCVIRIVTGPGTYEYNWIFERQLNKAVTRAGWTCIEKVEPQGYLAATG